MGRIENFDAMLQDLLAIEEAKSPQAIARRRQERKKKFQCRFCTTKLTSSPNKTDYLVYMDQGIEINQVVLSFSCKKCNKGQIFYPEWFDSEDNPQCK